MDEKLICRLCFTVGDIECDEVDDIVTEMLEVLLLAMDLKVIGNPTICQNCAGIIKRSFHFKSMCTQTEKLVASFALYEKKTKFKLKDIFSDNMYRGMAIETDFRCRFCTKVFKLRKNIFVSIRILMEQTLYREMLPAFMPEVDFSIVENSIICVQCKQNLESYLKFARDCLDVENKIYIYCQHKVYGEHIKLSDVLNFLRNLNLGGSRTHLDEQKLATPQELEEQYYCKPIKIEDLDIKDEVALNESLEQSQSRTISPEPLFNHNEFMWKINQSKSVEGHLEGKSRDTKVQDMIEHKCPLCAYTAKWKVSVRKHMLTHQDAGEINMYQCSRCLHETTRKDHLTTHMLTHYDASQVKMYKCQRCPYETKYKYHVKIHKLVHRNASEVKLHKCTLCTFETNYKQCLKIHMSSHNKDDLEEVNTYKCDRCTYETKRKVYLIAHVQKHKDTCDAEVYKCSLCGYKTTYRTFMKRHNLSHKTSTMVELYKCASCLFQTKYKQSLTRHMLTHPRHNSPHVETFKCFTCGFQTKHKSALKRHIVTHQV